MYGLKLISAEVLSNMVYNQLSNQSWQSWRIKLNADKTWCVNFHKDTKNKNYPKLYLSGEQLKYKKACKFLGITFDETLTFENHIENIATRAKNV